MNDHIEVLILNQNDYREHDVMFRALSKEYGALTFIAAGARKMTSKNAGSILPYTKAEIHFDYKEGKRMFRMKTASTRNLYRKLHEDLNLSACASFASETAMAMHNESEETAIEEYEMLETVYDALNTGRQPVTVLALYISDMMKLFGIGADVDECVICGNTTVHAVSAKEGGFLCADCAERLSVPFKTPNELKRFRILVKGSLRHLEMIEKAGGASLADLEILAGMLKLHAGIELRSFAFLKRIFALKADT